MPAVTCRRSLALLVAVPAAAAIGSTPAIAASEGPAQPLQGGEARPSQHRPEGGP